MHAACTSLAAMAAFGVLHAACTKVWSMVARATRSASRKARATEAVATGPLGALSHDELGVIVDGLADPLQPVVAVAFSSTCLGLRTPLRAALEVLQQQHEKAKALCHKMKTSWKNEHGQYQPCSCAWLRDSEIVIWYDKLNTKDMVTLGIIMRMNGLPKLQKLFLCHNGFADTGMHVLCESLCIGAAPSLRVLVLQDNKFGPAGAEALAAALGRGAFPKIESLHLYGNPVGNRGVTALAASLSKLPALTTLYLGRCEIDDEGVASLVDNLGKDDFKALEKLFLNGNKVTDAGVAKLLAALNAGGLPKLVNQPFLLKDNPASAVAVEAVQGALVKRGAPVE